MFQSDNTDFKTKMTSFILSAALIAMIYIINGISGSTVGLPEHQRTKRSDSLIRDVVRQMVAEHLERKSILAKFQKMEDRLDNVKRELKERNTLLHDTKFLQKKLEGLVKVFKEEVRSATKDDVKKELTHFRKSMSTVSKGLKQRFSRFTTKSSKQMELFHNEVVTLQNQIANNSRKPQEAVAFSAKLNSNVKTSSVLMFTKVLTNIGGGYHSNAGMFYCPKDGMYMFSVTLQALSKNYVEGYIMKNNIKLAQLYSEARSTAHPSTSLTLMVQLKTKDRVWVKGVGHKYNHYSFFSGSLITF